ncbi:MAG: gamma-glutamyl-gamma-aminobutyrate hydrolase family protein [Clostridia bacterium]|nr:gamma-glutamyl-gamma-aminobutyrate hydrolase family protein [Clostridia bacterium]
MKKILLTAGEGMPVNYMKALQRLGAEGAVAVEPDAAGFDGLLLCGGGDPDPALFGEKNEGSFGISRERDQLELSCIHLFLKAGKPILGICRGNQILNVAFGGSLVQHLPTANEHLAPGKDLFHEIRTDGLLRKLYGKRVTVNSRHHQGIGKVGRGLKVIGVAPDGVVEAVAHERLPVLGVQFHPERMENGLPVLESFLKLC